MKCVIVCFCGMNHMIQCNCTKRYSKKALKEGFICKKIRVLPHCSQYYPKRPVKVIPNSELVKDENGEWKKIIERRWNIPGREHGIQS